MNLNLRKIYIILVKPVLVAGSKLQFRRGSISDAMCDTAKSFSDLATSLSCAVAVMPDAKGFRTFEINDLHRYPSDFSIL